MSVMLIGVLAVVLILGIASFSLFSSMSGVTTVTRALGVGAAGGVVGSILAVFTNAWEFVVACAYGHLSFYGYLFIIGLGLCLIVWSINGLNDVKKNRPIGFVD